MKNLILILSLCFVLFSCFEKEEEVTVVPKEPIEEGNVMECEAVKQLISYVLANPPKEPRAFIEKYMYKEQYVFVLEEGGEPYPDKMYTIINSKCEVVCYSGGIAGNICKNFDKAEYIEKIWIDVR